MKTMMNIRAERGAALVEFAVVVPLFLIVMIGTFQFGLTMNNYVVLTDAVRAGARQFAISRGVATGRTATVNRVNGAAPAMSGGMTITTKVNNSACATDVACLAALTAGAEATVTATFPCSLRVYGVNFVPGGCILTSVMTERVE